MNAFGLINYWNSVNFANPYQCLDQKTKKKSSNNPRLSTKNLTGAFIVLLVGHAASFIAFMFERLVSNWCRYRCNGKISTNNRVVEK